MELCTCRSPPTAPGELASWEEGEGSVKITCKWAADGGVGKSLVFGKLVCIRTRTWKLAPRPPRTIPMPSDPILLSHHAQRPGSEVDAHCILTPYRFDTYLLVVLRGTLHRSPDVSVCPEFDRGITPSQLHATHLGEMTHRGMSSSFT